MENLISSAFTCSMCGDTLSPPDDEVDFMDPTTHGWVIEYHPVERLLCGLCNELEWRRHADEEHLYPDDDIVVIHAKRHNL